TEPVHMENFRRLSDALAHLQPVLEIIGHVVPAERKHGHRIAAGYANSAGGGGRGLRSHGGADENSVLPVASLENKRSYFGAAPAEDECGDGHAVRIVKMLGIE